MVNKDKKGVLMCFLWCFHVCSTYAFVDFTLFSYDLHWSYMFSHVSVIKLFFFGVELCSCFIVLLLLGFELFVQGRFNNDF